MRSLASVQEIGKIEPIENADRIELAHVLGWQCVVPKGEYRVGDKVIFFEPDSFLPIKPEYEFLRPSSYKKTDHMGEGFLISSRHLRGQLSQGLIMPCTEELEIGTDVTDMLEPVQHLFEGRKYISLMTKKNLFCPNFYKAL